MIRLEIASGTTVESRVRALTRYLENRRKNWPAEELASFPDWAETTAREAIERLARDVAYVETSEGVNRCA